MRFLPFKALLVLVVCPPIIYLLALMGAESLFAGHYHKKVQKHVPGDTRPLLDGQITLVDMLQRNIEDLNHNDPWLSHGVTLAVVVKTAGGRRLFPPVYLETEDEVGLRHPAAVASQNYALLEEGLVVALDVKINQNTLIANVILAFCLLGALSALGYLYRRGTRKLAFEEQRRSHEIQQWRARAIEQRASLASMKTENEVLLSRIDEIQSAMEVERSVAHRTEEDLFDEMAKLEHQLQENLIQQKQQEGLIADLEQQLVDTNRSAARRGGHHHRTEDVWRRRLASLYKKIRLTDRAVKGFTKLPESLQIKAEEVIHQLNAEPEKVSIKRKLFQRKGRETVFEVVFARKGRLYFRHTKTRKIEILAIGTKNDQWRDLGFLDRMA